MLNRSPLCRLQTTICLIIIISISVSIWSCIASGETAELVQVDLLLKHGKVIDGSGSDPKTRDVGIRGDRIVFIGNAEKSHVTATRTIDVSGLVVSPGFIDPHTHTLEDLSDPKHNTNEDYLMQGVTTVITGNDGSSARSVADTLKKWDQQGIGTNAALLAGHGTIRTQVIGSGDVQPTPDQLEQMRRLMAEAMDDGAFGMSTGLYYVPGVYSKTEEVIELAKVAASKGGVYDTHMRDESSYSIGFLGSVQETVRIGREARIPVHISHIKALGPEVWGQSKAAIKLIKQARSQGVDVTANQYPYTASGTNLVAALVPSWAQEGGREQLRRRIEDPTQRPRLVSEMEANLKRRGGAASLLVTNARNRELVGKTLDALSKQWNKPPIETTFEIIRTEGTVSLASFNMSEKDIENFMKQPWVMTGSDGSTGHPRKYGTFPRKLREYVYNKKLISLPFAIKQSSSLTAETFHIRERGRLRVDYFADVIVFDEKTVGDKSTYQQPELLAEGMRFVIVNGKLVVEDGKYNGTLAGHALRKNR